MLFIVVGDSCSGKTTLVDDLVFKVGPYCLGLSKILQYTTRPRRDLNDNDYYFCKELNREDCISYSEYEVINSKGEKDIWKYGYRKMSLDKCSSKNQIMISNASELPQIVHYANTHNMPYTIYYVFANKNELFKRALDRPNYHIDEIIRRYNKDCESWERFDETYPEIAQQMICFENGREYKYALAEFSALVSKKMDWSKI